MVVARATSKLRYLARAKARRWNAPIRRRLQPRRLHAYGVGAGKSGTGSLAGIFARGYRTAHEPGVYELIDHVAPARGAPSSPAELRRFAVRRDAELWLEFESSQLTVYLLEHLVDAFPDARFLLPIRDCYSWLDSVLNFRRSFWETMDAPWRRIEDLQVGTAEPGPGEELLRAAGLRSLDGYLGHWAGHNRRVLETVPSDRLLVVRTNELGESLSEIARFLDIEEASLHRERAHINRARAKYGLMAELDPALIEATVELHCRELMDEFYPGVGLANSGVVAG